MGGFLTPKLVLFQHLSDGRISFQQPSGAGPRSHSQHRSPGEHPAPVHQLRETQQPGTDTGSGPEPTLPPLLTVRPWVCYLTSGSPSFLTG